MKKYDSTPLSLALRGALVIVPTAALAYWTRLVSGVYINRIELCILIGIGLWAAVERYLYRQAQPMKVEASFDEDSGYYRLPLSALGPGFDDETDVCFATEFERDKIPEPRRESGVQVVSRIYCIVDEKFWAWRETFNL